MDGSPSTSLQKHVGYSIADGYATSTISRRRAAKNVCLEYRAAHNGQRWSVLALLKVNTCAELQST